MHAFVLTKSRFLEVVASKFPVPNKTCPFPFILQGIKASNLLGEFLVAELLLLLQGMEIGRWTRVAIAACFVLVLLLVTILATYGILIHGRNHVNARSDMALNRCRFKKLVGICSTNSSASSSSSPSSWNWTDHGKGTSSSSTSASSSSSSPSTWNWTDHGKGNSSSSTSAAGVVDDDKRVVPTGPNPLHNR